MYFLKINDVKVKLVQQLFKKRKINKRNDFLGRFLRFYDVTVTQGFAYSLYYR